ncbi:hypothetical protein GCM10023216_01090 [Isoptericola chiayiensis]|uniref:Schlafen AlbA-2 domain-containing protein n=1 Tax=Isoptericola chiayiensis TaxID=579446 RepID=A0ABP8XZS5_9MICO|nr:ATP-binding protein [Isoptericola chiayiensis]NOW01329.1 hypothetical protein [Isoptericola chiayiensis]
MADDMDQIPDMTQGELVRLLDRLTAAWENEVVEFKDANDDFSTDKIGKYVSALSNEANLRGAEAGWLVFGVHDKSRTVIGTDYRLDPAHLDSLKRQIEQGAEPSLTAPPRSVRRPAIAARPRASLAPLAARPPPSGQSGCGGRRRWRARRRMACRAPVRSCRKAKQAHPI